jgi:hypothetical protein
MSNIKTTLNNVNWEVLKDENANEAYNNFENILINAIDKYAPETIKKIKYCNIIREPWMTTGLLTSGKKLNRLFNDCANKNKNDITYQNYITYRNKYNSLKRKAKVTYFQNKIDEYKKEGKKMWKIINELTGKCKNKQSSLNYINIEGIKTYNKELLANHVCSYFSNVGHSLVQ